VEVAAMNEILAGAKSIRSLLEGVKYKIDYYQREYKWQTKQVVELVNDLTTRFLEDYQQGHERKQVANYGRYFLGSVIVSKKDGTNYIVDGQQRLTTITLLLIYLRNLQEGRPDEIYIDKLIYSEKYGEKSFNLEVDERYECMSALFEGRTIDISNQPDSVQNLIARYEDIETAFPEEIKGTALPYFVDWLLENVYLVEICAYSDDDAYTIFETMNDRGLSLSPTDMMRGYILANIDDPNKRNQTLSQWKERTAQLRDYGAEVEPDFFKAWFRSQYAQKIRERKRGAKAEDFDRIGTEFHRWLRDASTEIGLRSSDDFLRFIERNFEFYSRQYLRLMRASQKLEPKLEHVFYNAQNGFTLQYMLLLAPLTPEDSDDTATLKMSLVARFIDILITRRIYNYRSIAYSTMQYAMFLVMREIRGLEPDELATALKDKLASETETFRPEVRFALHQQNRRFVHNMLARITDFVERESGFPSRYKEYIATGKNAYEVEHIWADKPDRYENEFPDPHNFREARNRFGGLLLLPKSLNASYGADSYEEKREHYITQNLLAQSLHPLAYEKNPGFKKFMDKYQLPFEPYDRFGRTELEKRCELYRRLAELIWNPETIAVPAE
jgi:hypothetical protein